MNIRDIEYFVALAEQGSFNRAAVHCNTTQPTISNSIQRMERELGTSLFKRTTRSLALTKKGLEILECSHNILINVNAIKDIAGSKEKHNKIINLGVSPSLAYYFYDRISVSASKTSNVDVDIKIHEMTKSNLKIQLDSGIMNCTLIACDNNDIVNFEKILVGEYPFFLAVHTEDNFANRESVFLSDIKNRTVLLIQDDNIYDSSLKKMFINCNLDHKQDLIFNSLEVVKMAIRSKKGIGLIPEYALKKNDSIHYIPIKDLELKSRVFVIFRRNDSNRDCYKKMSEILRFAMNNEF